HLEQIRPDQDRVPTHNTTPNAQCCNHRKNPGNPYCNVNLVAGSSAIHEAQGTDFVFTPQHQLAQS
ncbi:hypothetical protein, partial [Kocuria rosea]|uniref:hypothetical protein n=1 Tax=Kocuria rosea TaxID=1275 RepID=UPI002B2554E6